MIEVKLAQVLAGYRARRDGYLSTSKSYTSKCHIMKRLELEKLAKVCDMHINELQRAIEGFSSVQAEAKAQPVRTRRPQGRAADTTSPSVRYGEVEGNPTSPASEGTPVSDVSENGQDRGSDDL